MDKTQLVKAWKDPAYRKQLTNLDEHPSGAAIAEMDQAYNGEEVKPDTWSVTITIPITHTIGIKQSWWQCNLFG